MQEVKNGFPQRLNRYGIFAIIREVFVLIISFILLFGAAGTLIWYNAWIYLILAALQQLMIILILLFKNPELLNERGKAIKEGTVYTDKIFVIIYFFIGFGSLIVAGFDAVRYQWTAMSDVLIIPGVILFLLCAVLGNWAMAENTFFETTLRIQRERGHRVIKTGPYRLVRHPGYTAWMLGALAFPLILGSWISYLPALMGVAVFIMRTAVEDSYLRKELPGYEDYARKTKYRLFPCIW